MAEEENKVDEEIRRELNKYIEGVTTQTEDEGIYNKLEELLGKYRREHNKEMIECPICFTEYPENEMYTVQPCRHKFCFTCLIEHINANIDKICGDIACPEVGCGSLLFRDELHGNVVIDDNVYNNWLKSEYNFFENTDGSLKQCPRCNKKLQISKNTKPGEEKRVECPGCHYVFCKICGKDVCS